MNLLKDSIPKELKSFCKICNTGTVSRAAIIKARAKLAPDAFISMNIVLIEEFQTFHELIRAFTIRDTCFKSI